MTYEVPKGWTRAAAIQVNTAPSPYLTDPRVLAAVTPYHATAQGSCAILNFATVADFEAWRKWWFDAPLPNPDPSFTKTLVAAPKAAPVNPFAQPTAKSVNPFAKPANPFI